MPTIKDIIVKNMRKIAIIMVAVLFLFSTAVQLLSVRQMNRENAAQVFAQIEHIMGEDRAAEKDELARVFDLFRTGVGYGLYAVDPALETIVGSTVLEAVDQSAAGTGFRADQLASGRAFFARVNGERCYCLTGKLEGYTIVWTMPLSQTYRSILRNEIILLAGLALISVILVLAVSGAMKRSVIDQIKRVNENLRAIRHGDLKREINIKGSKEFQELSAHINGMVASLLQSSEKLEMSEQINSQKEALERQQAELEVAVKRAEEANRAKSEFLFNMSHDIRTPMNAIMGFTRLALESGEEGTQREYLEKIDVSSKQLLDLIDNILELSRIENHKTVIEEDLVNVEKTCRDLCTIFDSDIKAKGVTSQVHMDIQHPYMYMDATSYAKIFLNIVSNAVKYTPCGGLIDVTFREVPGDGTENCFIETVVEDNGIGMSAEFLEHAYESFARERTSTDSGQQGTGLGLAIVKNLVDLMDGTVRIESQQGKGTKVTVRLPHRLGEVPAEEKEERRDNPEQKPFQGRCVLMAEDIDINAIIAEKLLTNQGFTVERAKDGVECVDMLQKADEGYYDLILMDIQMPNMDGYQAAQAIRSMENEKRASIPILALTANAFKEDKEKAAESGMDGHIAKPLDAVKMFQTIAEALENSAD